MDGVELAPLRPLEDFLLGSARFQLPDYKNFERWSNRVINNLLYYQTNYFLSATLIFIIVGLLHPLQMMFGCISVFGALLLFVFASNNQAELQRFKQNHSGLSLALILIAGYAVIYIFGSVIVFMFGIALPLLVIFIHASLRLRNLKNKIARQVEYVGIRRTPMGDFLESIGLKLEAGL